MTNGISLRQARAATIGFGVIGVTIYLIMVTVTLFHLETVSGLVPFDMRPLGYSHAEATALLSALGAEGRAYYLTRQIPLDTVYPALLALTLCAALCWMGYRVPNSKLVRIGLFLAFGAALFDYAENLGIVALIRTWPNTPAPLVIAASAATIVKSGLTSFAVLVLCLVGIFAIRSPEAEDCP